MELAGTGADWRDAGAYAPLLVADRSIFAWEWLRRDPAYRRAAERAGAGGRGAAEAAWRCGLVRFESPLLGAPHARPFWRADRHDLVLRARALQSRAPGDALDLGTLLGACVFRAGGQEHWLFSDGLRAIRVDLIEGTAIGRPVELHYLLSGREALRGPLLSLRRLAALAGTGRFSKSMHAPEPRARRWLLALRVHDALAAGAGQREIAAQLLGGAAGALRWRIETPSLRSQAQRLVREALRLAAGGWAGFLGVAARGSVAP